MLPVAVYVLVLLSMLFMRNKTDIVRVYQSKPVPAVHMMAGQVWPMIFLYPHYFIVAFLDKLRFGHSLTTFRIFSCLQICWNFRFFTHLFILLQSISISFQCHKNFYNIFDYCFRHIHTIFRNHQNFYNISDYYFHQIQTIFRNHQNF
jgi:hypothetical protein